MSVPWPGFAWAVNSKVLFVIEVLVIATVFHLDYIGILPVSKTPYLFLLGWISLRVRGLRWKDIGLRVGGRAPSRQSSASAARISDRPVSRGGTEAVPPFSRFLVIGAAVGIGMEALELFATQPLLTNLLKQGPNLHEMQALVGNTKILVLALVLTWVLAAFGEEMVWRGYLLNRIADIFRRSKSAWIAAAVFSSLLFGLAHFPQGPTGIIENIIDGGILAAVYFATGRNLIAPIIAHGIQDTVDVLLIYFGIYPGLRSQLALF